MTLLFKVIPVHHTELSADVVKHRGLAHCYLLYIIPDIQLWTDNGTGARYAIVVKNMVEGKKIICLYTAPMVKNTSSSVWKMNCFQYPMVHVKLNFLKIFLYCEEILIFQALEFQDYRDFIYSNFGQSWNKWGTSLLCSCLSVLVR